MAMELIETIEVGTGGAASIEFTSIPQDGLDLLIVLSARSDNTGVFISGTVNFNNDTASNYDVVDLEGAPPSGSFGNSFSALTFGRVGRVNAGGSTANTFSNAQIYVSNYTSSTNKYFLSDSVTENNALAGYEIISSNKYISTQGITTVTLDCFSNFVEYSTASLYKIY